MATTASTFRTSTQRPEFFYSHNRQDEFTINQALVGLRFDNGQVHGALGLQGGTYPEANYAAEPELLRNIYEAYAGFRPFKKAWLDLGVFGSHIGYESAISKDNWTVTHSLAAEGSPYYEAGVKLSYELSPKLTVTGLVLNGWQNIRDNNRGKALGTQVQWRPSEKWLVNSSTFFGNEQPQDSARRYRYYYAQYGVVVRFLNPTPAQRDFFVRVASLNVDYASSRHVLVRLEGKFLNSKNARFPSDAGSPATSYGNLTSTVALSF